MTARTPTRRLEDAFRRLAQPVRLKPGLCGGAGGRGRPHKQELRTVSHSSTGQTLAADRGRARSPGRVLPGRSVAELAGVPTSGWFSVTTATLDLPMSADGSHNARCPQSDEDMYLAVTLAWCRMFLRTERRKYPLGPYVLGEDFIRSVVMAPLDAHRVAAVCARIASLHTYGDRESWPVDTWPHEELDSTAAWWCAIEEPDGLGVHHVEICDGTLEFLSVAYYDDRPGTTGGGDLGFWLALSAGQVRDLLVQEAVSRGGGRGLLWVVLALIEGGERVGLEELARDESYRNGRVCRSVVHSLLVLSAFTGGRAHSAASLASELGLSVEATCLYVNTWVELGLLQDRQDDFYQVAPRWSRWESSPAWVPPQGGAK
jgi:hypothetical protein